MSRRQFLSHQDFEDLARRRLPSMVYGYVAGGTEDGLTRDANRQAFRDYAFMPRGLAGIAVRSQAVELWGQTWASPFGIAPMGVAAICRHQCDRIFASTAAQAGLPFILSGLSTEPLENIQRQAPGTWYQGYLPGDKQKLEPLLARLKRAGFEVLVVTIDTPVGANRENNQRAGFTIPFKLSASLVWQGLTHPRWSLSVFMRTLLSQGIPRFTNVSADPSGFRINEEPAGGLRGGRDRLDWEHLRWIRKYWPGKIVLKGVAHPEDARLAVECGLDGVIVSNHGGRQLDGAQASLHALPAVVAAVPADFPVMVDGGFRRGTDILKAIALGARMVFIGRPMIHAAAAHGEQGVARLIEILKTEVDTNLALLGCTDLRELDGRYITKAR
ncbi:alpha-hydroxy acid oxidase [Lacisediminimonas profundi]|uniref:alpha-hydroxy acid oxidase n=1 Tax=Lacisediminimonas profundi TaxID=2603856 RepID=UPI00124AEE07|nr:alpha-hydroxy acid oxidase [Lacisediminimonas profundi]